ncbi:MAG: replication initiator protein [Wigfec virus K19_81]|nr:MAG: replication initiator protein [Wigfec virus K19_81]
MCVRQSLIKNRKYSMTKKNKGMVPYCNDKRQLNVLIPCKQCYICRRKKAREWRMRIAEDIKENQNAKIVTLTFNTKSLKKLAEECKGVEGYELDNQICKRAVKLFRERWRKKYGKSPRHWLITELGHGETEHVHMHGIIWEDSRYKLEDTLLNEIEKIWNYGFVGKGKKCHETGRMINYVDASTANYFTKYVNKIDAMHPEYKQIILTSAGIGKAFLYSQKAKDNRYQGKETNQMYNVDNGGVLPMPEYFRKKLYTEEQREKLAGWYLDRNVIYLDGKEIRLEIGDIKISALKRELRRKNTILGYGDGRKNWARKHFENQRRKELHKKRFWEGKTKAEIKKEQEAYWLEKPKEYINETHKWWEELTRELEENKVIKSMESQIRPNMNFDQVKEVLYDITKIPSELQQKTRQDSTTKEIYRYNVIDCRGKVKNRYTLIESENSEARIKAARNIKEGERISRVY